MNETINLSVFAENPDNPYKATDAELARLKGKLERVPKGLRAMRLAYVTDFIARDGTSYAGKCVVISGNKRLRELKAIYGDNAEVPAEWFADVTDMTAAERHEFIVSANTVDGTPDIDKLLEQYAQDELVELMGDEACAELLRSVSEASAEEQKQQPPPPKPYTNGANRTKHRRRPCLRGSRPANQPFHRLHLQRAVRCDRIMQRRAHPGASV